MDTLEAAPDSLSGRVVLVTGAGSGIGRAVSIAFAAHGATVVLLGRSVHKLESVYDEIEQAGNPQPAIYPMDLLSATPDDYSALADSLDREFGRLDGLLHNAALLGALTPVANHDIELWYHAFQVNLHAPFLLTRACLGVLQRSADASIIFTADSAGRHGRAYWGAYATAKAGAECLMQILADELETNTRIRVNSIDPGPVRSRLRALAYPAEDPARLAKPEDVVRPFVYLMGPQGKGLTGRQFSAKGFRKP
jgi:NAD(P)-dependent dehydrogenase (short-subunit alcohol dehydrogenase family)